MGLSALIMADEWPGTGEGLHGGRQRRGWANRLPVADRFRLIAAGEAVHATLDRLHTTHHRQEPIISCCASWGAPTATPARLLGRQQAMNGRVGGLTDEH